ncbi:TATA box-binding protein-associated factor RNA polymerase I subunit C [Trichoplax sp. H2]|nr:TATA box-binding protein-associated factor RNA polymerase I subunit C [Trichoplax sp. H2]|eukprot:RDD46296.1 TATA box-binding protein-associated factor RNA polymerase I subunit C [Trichoplax sp. H2]
MSRKKQDLQASDRFPAANFSYSSRSRKSLSFVDYGESPAYLFKLSSCNDDRTTFGREAIIRKHHGNDSKLSLIASQPTLPLTMPNARIHENFGPISAITTNVQNQILYFQNRYDDVIFQSLRSLFGYELKDNIKFSKTNHGHTLSLSEAIVDLPLDLLEEYLGESLEIERKKSTENCFHGNCISYHPFDNSANKANVKANGILIYPSGKSHSILNAAMIKSELKDYHFANKLPFCSLKLSKKQSFAINGQIHEITPVIGNLVGVRADYNCALLKVKCHDIGNFLNNDDIECSFLECCSTFQLNYPPRSICLNPYIDGEMAIVCSSGGIQVWSESNGSREIRANSNYLSHEELLSSWYGCQFAGHPRLLAVASSSDFDLIDFRVKPLKRRSLFAIPTSHLLINEKFVAIQRHSRPFYHLLGTQQSLLLLDERFPSHPVLKWRHHLRSNPFCISTVQDIFSNQPDDLALIGSYNSHEIHCYQFTTATASTAPIVPLLDREDSCVGPPRSTELHWQISNYSEWPALINKGKLGLWLASDKRLDAPLIGMTTVSHDASEGGGLHVIQASIYSLSACGDIFYQTYATVERNRMLLGLEDYDKTCSLHFCQSVPETPDFIKQLCLDWSYQAEQIHKDLEHKQGGTVSYDYNLLSASDLRQCLIDTTATQDYLCPCCQRYPENIQSINSSHNFNLNSQQCSCGLTTDKSTVLFNAYKEGAILKSNGDTRNEASDLILVQNPKSFSDQFSKNIWSIWDINENIGRPSSGRQNLQSSDMVQSFQQREILSGSQTETLLNDPVINPSRTSQLPQSSTLNIRENNNRKRVSESNKDSRRRLSTRLSDKSAKKTNRSLRTKIGF